MRLAAALTLVTFAGALGIAAGVGADRIVPTNPLVRGLAIGGHGVGEVASPNAWLAERRDALKQQPIRLVIPGRSGEPANPAVSSVRGAGDGVFETTLGDAGIALDVDATLARAAAVGHVGSPLRRVREARAAARGEIDVAPVWSLDEPRLRELLGAIASAERRDPVDARIDLATHAKTVELPGEEIDVEASLAAIREAAYDGDDDAVALAVRAIPPRITLADLASVDVSKLVAAHETQYVLWGSGSARAVNIRAAAAKIDGIVLYPGDVLSFNQRVGPRTLDRGFAVAPEILDDELQPGIGGGTCQVSTTLHVAALYGALDVVERHPHSHPSNYATVGLDATVSYPDLDLKLKNTLPFPVLIHATFPKPTPREAHFHIERVRVEILGGDPVAKVSYGYSVSNREDFVRRIRVMPNLAAGQRIRHQRGSEGLDVWSVAHVDYLDGRSEARQWSSNYRPAPEVYYVAPGYDEADLPPLPDHAKGVEVKLAKSRRADPASAAEM